MNVFSTNNGHSHVSTPEVPSALTIIRRKRVNVTIVRNHFYIRKVKYQVFLVSYTYTLSSPTNYFTRLFVFDYVLVWSYTDLVDKDEVCEG